MRRTTLYLLAILLLIISTGAYNSRTSSLPEEKPVLAPPPFTLIELLVVIAVIGIIETVGSPVYRYPVNDDTTACGSPLVFKWNNIFEKGYFYDGVSLQEMDFFYALHIYKQSDSSLVYSTLNDNLMLKGANFSFDAVNDSLAVDSTYYWRLQVFFDNQKDVIFSRLPYTTHADLVDLSDNLYDDPDLGAIALTYFSSGSYAYEYSLQVNFKKFQQQTTPFVENTNFTRCVCSPAWADKLPGTKCADDE